MSTETILADNKQATAIDFWAFRSKSKPEKTRELVKFMFKNIGGLKVEFKKSGSGWQGFQEKETIQDLNGMNLGIFAHGGVHQNGWSYTGISGRGCEWLRNIDASAQIASQLELYELRRVDIALTLQDGSVGHSDVLSAYKAGEFNLGGRPPSLKQVLGSGVGEGKTIYIGSRTRDKFFRGYEKGFELLKYFPENLRAAVTHINGNIPIEDIYRLEVEYKPKTCALPRDLITYRDNYFSGSYPYLQKVLKSEPLLMELKKETTPQLNLEASLDWIRRQYGKTLFTALVAYDGDIGRLMDRIIGTEHNRRLVETGVLSVEH